MNSFKLPQIAIGFFTISIALAACNLSNDTSSESIVHAIQENLSDTFSEQEIDSMFIVLDTLGNGYDTRRLFHIDPVLKPATHPPQAFKIDEPEYLGKAYQQTMLGEPKHYNYTDIDTQLLDNAKTIDLTFRSIALQATLTQRVQAKSVETNSPFRVRMYDVDNGLVDNKVSGMTQDKNGVLWYTYEAIKSFDGTYNKLFVPETGMLTSSMDPITDPHGNIWFVKGWDKRLMRFDGNFLNQSSLDGVNLIGTNNDGNLLLQKDSSLFRLDGNRVVEIGKAPWLNEGVRSASTASDGTVYIVGKGHVGIVKNQKVITAHLHNLGVLNSVGVDVDDRVWIASDKGLILFEEENYLAYDTSSGLSSLKPREILCDSKGKVWICNGDDMNVIDENIVFTLPIESYYNNSFYSMTIRNMFEDQNGQVWVSTIDDGFQVIAEGLISTINLKEKLIDQTDLLEVNGKLWIANKEGLYIYNPETEEIWKHNQVLDHFGWKDNVRLALKDGDVYISTGTQIGRLDGDSLYMYGKPQGLEMIISDLEVDRHNKLWIGGPSHLYSFDGERFSDEIPHIKQPVNTLSLDKQGNVMVTHGDFGIMRRLDNGWTSLVSEVYGFPWTAAMSTDSIFLNGSWSNGFYATKGEKYFRLDIKNGLSSNYIKVLYTDSFGNAWLGGQSLQVIEGANLNRVLSGKDDQLEILEFSKLDGLNADYFASHSGEAYLNGVLYLQNGDAIIKVRPNELLSKSENIPIISWVEVDDEIQSFASDGKSKKAKWDSADHFTNVPTNLKLFPTASRIRFGFSMVDLRSAHRTQYRYKLRGSNQHWSKTKEQPVADFTALRHGKYVLEVQCRKGGFKWSDSRLYQFEILPPWYFSKTAYTFYVLFGVIIVILIIRWRTAKLKQDKERLERIVDDRTAEVRKEKQKSDELLLNILPEEIAHELKEKGESQARGYDLVSVIFTDFVKFTEISSKLDPKEVVERINSCFKAFDQIMEKHGIEKIKTIGDAYMAASGLPIEQPNVAQQAVIAALEMQAFIEERSLNFEKEGKESFKMRVGVHTGPVVAGIVGVKKFQYDIWGDTVNTASRMESSGEVGKVNISQETYELIKDDALFEFEHRGKISAKGKGEVDMYFVSNKIADDQ